MPISGLERSNLSMLPQSLDNSQKYSFTSSKTLVDSNVDNQKHNLDNSDKQNMNAEMSSNTTLSTYKFNIDFTNVSNVESIPAASMIIRKNASDEDDVALTESLDLSDANRHLSEVSKYDAMFLTKLGSLVTGDSGNMITPRSENDLQLSVDPVHDFPDAVSEAIKLETAENPNICVTTGILDEIRRVYVAIGKTIYIWDATEVTSSSSFIKVVKYTASCNILSAYVVRPLPGVFISSVNYVLLLVTKEGIQLLSIEAAYSNQQLNVEMTPTPITIALESMITSIASLRDGTVLLSAKDGCIYELQYSVPDPNNRKRKQSGFLRSFLSNEDVSVSKLKNHTLSSFLGKMEYIMGYHNQPIIQISVDEYRSTPLVYTFASNGDISVYFVTRDNNGNVVLDHRGAITYTNLIAGAQKRLEIGNVASSRFLHNSRPVSLIIVGPHESSDIFAYVITDDGHRVYIRLYSPPNTHNLLIDVSFVRLACITKSDGSAVIASAPKNVHAAASSKNTMLLAHNVFSHDDSIPYLDLATNNSNSNFTTSGSSQSHSTSQDKPQCGNILSAFITLPGEPEIDGVAVYHNYTHQPPSLNLSIPKTDLARKFDEVVETIRLPSKIISLPSKPTPNTRVLPRIYEHLVEKSMLPVLLHSLSCQHAVPPAKYPIMTATGVTHITKRRPIDIVATALAQFKMSGSSQTLNMLCQVYGRTEVTCMCTLLAAGAVIEPNLVNYSDYSSLKHTAHTSVCDDTSLSTVRITVRNRSAYKFAFDHAERKRRSVATNDQHAHRRLDMDQDAMFYGKEDDIDLNIEKPPAGLILRVPTILPRAQGITLALSRLLMPVWKFTPFTGIKFPNSPTPVPRTRFTLTQLLAIREPLIAFCNYLDKNWSSLTTSPVSEINKPKSKSSAEPKHLNPIHSKNTSGLVYCDPSNTKDVANFNNIVIMGAAAKSNVTTLPPTDGKVVNNVEYSLNAIKAKLGGEVANIEGLKSSNFSPNDADVLTCLQLQHQHDIKLFTYARDITKAAIRFITQQICFIKLATALAPVHSNYHNNTTQHNLSQGYAILLSLIHPSIFETLTTVQFCDIVSNDVGRGHLRQFSLSMAQAVLVSDLAITKNNKLAEGFGNTLSPYSYSSSLTDYSTEERKKFTDDISFFLRNDNNVDIEDVMVRELGPLFPLSDYLMVKSFRHITDVLMQHHKSLLNKTDSINIASAPDFSQTSKRNVEMLDKALLSVLNDVSIGSSPMEVMHQLAFRPISPATNTLNNTLVNSATHIITLFAKACLLSHHSILPWITHLSQPSLPMHSFAAAMIAFRVFTIWPHTNKIPEVAALRAFLPPTSTSTVIESNNKKNISDVTPTPSSTCIWTKGHLSDAFNAWNYLLSTVTKSTYTPAYVIFANNSASTNQPIPWNIKPFVLEASIPSFPMNKALTPLNPIITPLLQQKTQTTITVAVPTTHTNFTSLPSPSPITLSYIQDSTQSSTILTQMLNIAAQDSTLPLVVFSAQHLINHNLMDIVFKLKSSALERIIWKLGGSSVCKDYYLTSNDNEKASQLLYQLAMEIPSPEPGTKQDSLLLLTHEVPVPHDSNSNRVDMMTQNYTHLSSDMFTNIILPMSVYGNVLPSLDNITFPEHKLPALSVQDRVDNLRQSHSCAVLAKTQLEQQLQSGDAMDAMVNSNLKRRLNTLGNHIHQVDMLLKLAAFQKEIVHALESQQNECKNIISHLQSGALVDNDGEVSRHVNEMQEAVELANNKVTQRLLLDWENITKILVDCQLPQLSIKCMYLLNMTDDDHINMFWQQLIRKRIFIATTINNATNNNDWMNDISQHVLKLFQDVNYTKYYCAYPTVIRELEWCGVQWGSDDNPNFVIDTMLAPHDGNPASLKNHLSDLITIYKQLICTQDNDDRVLHSLMQSAVTLTYRVIKFISYSPSLVTIQMKNNLVDLLRSMPVNRILNSNQMGKKKKQAIITVLEQAFDELQPYL